jgi:hypothetical protein
LSQNAQKEELRKASEVLASSASLRGFDWSKEPDINDIDDDIDTHIAGEDIASSKPAFSLSSTLWTELLD